MLHRGLRTFTEDNGSQQGDVSALPTVDPIQRGLVQAMKYIAVFYLGVMVGIFVIALVSKAE